MSPWKLLLAIVGLIALSWIVNGGRCDGHKVQDSEFNNARIQN